MKMLFIASFVTWHKTKLLPKLKVLFSDLFFYVEHVTYFRRKHADVKSSQGSKLVLASIVLSSASVSWLKVLLKQTLLGLKFTNFSHVLERAEFRSAQLQCAILVQDFTANMELKYCFTLYIFIYKYYIIVT